MQKRRLLASFVLALTAVLPSSSFAAYPDKPIRLIVPSAAGGASLGCLSFQITSGKL